MIHQYFFPQQTRNIKFGRWIRILARSIHICGIIGYGGAIIYSVADESRDHFLLLTIISGMVLIATDIYKNGVWTIQNRGLLMIVKILILFFFVFSQFVNIWTILGITLLSSFVAHAPGNFRYYSVFFSRRIDTFPNANR